MRHPDKASLAKALLEKVDVFDEHGGRMVPAVDTDPDINSLEHALSE